MEASRFFSDLVTFYVAEMLYSMKLLLLPWASEILEKVNGNGKLDQQEQVDILISKSLVLQIYVVPCIILIIL